MVTMNSLQYNATEDSSYSLKDVRFDHVVHIFSHCWHGIRSAVSYLPGNKLAISPDKDLCGEELRYIIGVLFKYKIQKVCFHGFSMHWEALVKVLKETFKYIEISYVGHVSFSQFEHLFEIAICGKILELHSSGYINGLGSVKPRYNIGSLFFEKTLINYTLPVNSSVYVRNGGFTAFIPLENTWRKNLYVNTIGCLNSKYLDTIYMVNEPTCLDLVFDLNKTHVVGFQNKRDIANFYKVSDIVMNVTLVECQSMVFLEALAHGVPCLIKPMGLSDLSGLKLLELCEVSCQDDPYILADMIDYILALKKDNPGQIKEAIVEYLEAAKDMSVDRYVEFLRLG